MADKRKYLSVPYYYFFSPLSERQGQHLYNFKWDLEHRFWKVWTLDSVSSQNCKRTLGGKYELGQGGVPGLGRPANGCRLAFPLPSALPAFGGKELAALLNKNE